ncbi:hypothetical protein [Streptomyces sp. st77]|uniref:hypothetical protein n=1 Tax=Streptomyces sp. st77 TaxID=1828074 RepID=UPI0015CF7EA0|nr:hypothetical protein [Streptomyces sp. st77]
MTTGRPSPSTTDHGHPPLPWIGPTLHELLPGTPLGSTPLALRQRAGRAVAAAGRQDPVRRELVRQADRNSHTPVAALVAEMLTPPLPRHHTEEYS